MKYIPHALLLSSCALVACARDEQAIEISVQHEALTVSEVLEKDLAIAFDLGDDALVRAAQRRDTAADYVVSTGRTGLLWHVR